jgi:hypothetical protein
MGHCSSLDCADSLAFTSRLTLSFDRTVRCEFVYGFDFAFSKNVCLEKWLTLRWGERLPGRSLAKTGPRKPVLSHGV